MFLKRIAIMSFPSLGFYRGVRNYNHYHKREQEKKDIDNQPKYFYSTCFIVGLLGMITYINPFTLPFVLYKEGQRFEINIRGLEDEKTSDNYYKLL